MSDKELIEFCLREILNKSGYTDSGVLRQRDFEHLSTDIEKRTGILISVSTIKRLLNGQFNQLPQAATLNAIATYIGYDSWQDFRIKKHEIINGADELKPQPPAPLPKSKKRWTYYNVIIPGIAAVVFLVAASYSYFSKPDIF